MKANWIAFVAAMFAGLAMAPAAQAQTGAVQLVNAVKVDKEVVENGKIKHVLVEPNVVVPGDKLVYTISYHNTSAQAVKDFDLVNPLAGAVMLDSAGADALTVSVDGGKTWGKLAMLKVADAAGVSRAAQASDVTHLRWVLPLIAAGAKGAITYHAIVR